MKAEVNDGFRGCCGAGGGMFCDDSETDKLPGTGVVLEDMTDTVLFWDRGGDEVFGKSAENTRGKSGGGW